MLVSLSREAAPSAAISIPGPGPSEPQPSGPSTEVIKATPDVAPETHDLPDSAPSPSSGANSVHDVEDGDDDGATRGADPYSNLEGAFGNYLADEPRPMNAGGRGGDDLLF